MRRGTLITILILLLLLAVAAVLQIQRFLEIEPRPGGPSVPLSP